MVAPDSLSYMHTCSAVRDIVDVPPHGRSRWWRLPLLGNIHAYLAARVVVGLGCRP